MTDLELDAKLQEWWLASFPLAPLGTHARQTHVAWARWLLQQQEEGQQRREVER